MWRWVAAAVAAVALAFPGAALRYRQLTRAGARALPSSAPLVLDGGRAVVFLANGDLTGDNPDGGWEIFLLSVERGELKQLTHASDGDGADPLLNLELAADRAGRVIAFASSGDLTGENGDHNHEIFVADRDGTVRQLTHTFGGSGYCGGNVQPALDGDGRAVVFASDLDLTSEGNADGNCELFRIPVGGGRIVQLTSGRSPVGALNPALSDDGHTLLFASDEDLGGQNRDGNVELWVMHDRGAPRPLTRTRGGCYGFMGSFYPRLSADGRRAVFVSNRDLTGGNPDGNLEVFTATVEDGAFVQVTSSLSSGGGGCLDNYFPTISPDGRRIAFTSLVDVGAGGPPSGAADVYVADSDGARLQRLTSSASASDWPAFTGDGARLFFQSFADLAGENPAHLGELFAVDLPPRLY